MNGEGSTRRASFSFDCPEQEVFLNLWRTYDCLKAVEDQVFAKFDLSPQQYNALRLLKSVHPNSLQTLTLGRKLITRSPDTTRLLDRLGKRQLIQRIRPESNRRVVEVAISPLGIALLNEMQNSIVEMHQLQLGHLDAQQRSTLTQLLREARRPHDDESCGWL